jgi:hypothetical protein
VNPLIASKLNRPDLGNILAPLTQAGAPMDPYGGSSGMYQAGGGAFGSIPGMNVAAELQGRVTAGVLIVALIVVGGFYVWTRGVQA